MYVVNVFQTSYGEDLNLLVYEDLRTTSIASIRIKRLSFPYILTIFDEEQIRMLMF